MANASQQEIWDIHGFQNWNPGVGQTGTMIVEYYGNTIVNANGFRWVNHRGSWGLFFNNLLTGNDMDINVNQYFNDGLGSSGCDVDVNAVAGTSFPPPETTVNNTYVFKDRKSTRLNSSHSQI